MSGLTPLHIAVKHEHVAVVEVLVEHGVDVNTMNDDGPIPLQPTVYQNQLAVTELLIECGADLNVRDELGRSLVSTASLQGHAEMVNLLEKYSARSTGYSAASD